MKNPVLVVGAGPVGFTLASDLARYRVPVRLSDKALAAQLDVEARPPLREGGIWLARPDGYVAASAHEPSVIAGYLKRFVK